MVNHKTFLKKLTSDETGKKVNQLRLIIVHYHLRPGGVRRIIEMAVPFLVHPGGCDSVVLAIGEAPDPAWLSAFEHKLAGVKVELFVDAAFGYCSEHKMPRARLQARLRKSASLLFAQAHDAVVWFHNPSVGRNLALSSVLAEMASERKIPLIYHHHDWWFDNRWARWKEMRRTGFSTFAKALDGVFPSVDGLCHAVINTEDAEALKRCFPDSVFWMPNLALRPPAISQTTAHHVRRWLQGEIGVENARIWLVPCRVLRRKNLAEALLLTRWLAPDAWLVTTGGTSSDAERFYADALRGAAIEHRWPLKMGCLDGTEKFSVPELLAASDTVLLTSILEGFGLPYLEAAAAGRPMIARTLPNIAPDLAQFGFHFPQAYQDILIRPELFDWDGEVKRQRRFYRQWRGGLPKACQPLAGEPLVLAAKAPDPVPFSRLTLTAQLEILDRPPEVSLAACEDLNPFLATWRKRMDAGNLGVSPWPRKVEKLLGGKAYAGRFMEAVEAARAHKASRPADGVREQFVEARLDSAHQYPLLWKEQT